MLLIWSFLFHYFIPRINLFPFHFIHCFFKIFYCFSFILNIFNTFYCFSFIFTIFNTVFLFYLHLKDASRTFSVPFSFQTLSNRCAICFWPTIDPLVNAGISNQVNAERSWVQILAGGVHWMEYTRGLKLLRCNKRI